MAADNDSLWDRHKRANHSPLPETNRKLHRLVNKSKSSLWTKRLVSLFALEFTNSLVTSASGKEYFDGRGQLVGNIQMAVGDLITIS